MLPPQELIHVCGGYCGKNRSIRRIGAANLCRTIQRHPMNGRRIIERLPLRFRAFLKLSICHERARMMERRDCFGVHDLAATNHSEGLTKINSFNVNYLVLVERTFGR